MKDSSTEAALRRLTSIVRSFCQDPTVRVRIKETGWAFDLRSNELHVPAAALAALDSESCLCTVAHESGHRLISRFESMALVGPEAELAAELLNACEDPRVDHFAVLRFPGLEAAFSREGFRERREVAASAILSTSEFRQFALLCCLDGIFAEGDPADPIDIGPRVRGALTRTRGARRSMLYELPPIDLASIGPELDEYRREFAGLRSRTAALGPVGSIRDLLAIVHSARVMRIFLDEVWPVAQQLIADGDRAAAQPRDERERRRISPRGLPGPDPRGRGGVAAMARPTRRLELTLPAADGSPVVEGYESVQARIARLLPSTIDAFRTSLEPKIRPRWLGPRRRGRKLNLRGVMTAARDATRSDLVWSAKDAPQKPDPAVLVLADLSGSMRGPKVDALRDAVIVMADALAQLRVPLAIVGFQDVLVPLLGFDQALDAEARARLCELPLEAFGMRPEGNNVPLYNDDGPCLDEAADMLLAHRARDRILLVVSDGRPEGRRSTEQDLVRAIERLRRAPLRLVGLGLGPGTEHVAHFYPVSRSQVEVDDLAPTLRDLLAREFRRC